MGIDLFQISQSKGIYHTLYLWSMLSPKSPRAEDFNPAAPADRGPSDRHADREEPGPTAPVSAHPDTEL